LAFREFEFFERGWWRAARIEDKKRSGMGTVGV